MRTVNLIDFRGGYFTDYTAELMNDNDLLKAENCVWRDGLIKRAGKSQYSTSDWSTFDGIKGAIRAYINGAWYTVIALDDGSDVNFYYGTGTTFTAIDNTYDFTTGYNVEFAELDGHIVAVNGQDKPAVIYYDSGWEIENLETYDTRDWVDPNVFAGQWDNSEAVPFVPDNDDAFDNETGSANFELCSGTSLDGFYLACDLVFNKAVIYGWVASGTPTPEYTYWNGSSWATLTLLSSVDWTTNGTKTLEWDVPFAADGTPLMKVYNEDDSLNVDGVPNRYIIRVRFNPSTTAAASCDYVTLHHTQYLSQILFNEKPHTVYTHNGTMFMAERYIVNFSPYQTVKGWREFQTEEFSEKGRRVQQMISYRDVLVVFKEGTIYTYNTTSLADPIRSRPLTDVGAVSTRSAAVVGGLLFFVSHDGVYVFDGAKATKVSKHIESDINSWTLTNAAGIHYKNEYIVSFPTNDVALVVDPDTFRQDSMGNGQMSFYKFLNYDAHLFLWNRGADDNDYFLALVDADPPYIDRCDNGLLDNSDNIDMTAKTKFLDFTGFQMHKFMGRFKPKLKEVSAATGSDHTLNMYSEDGLKSASKEMEVPVGSGFYSTDISLPYSMDGKNISFELIHGGPTSACLIGYALQLQDRRF